MQRLQALILRQLKVKIDFKLADEQMRRKLNDPNWQRPKGYTLNHAGGTNSTTMEMIDTKNHAKVAHTGSAAEPRATAATAAASATKSSTIKPGIEQKPAAAASLPKAGMVPKSVAVLSVYMTLRDALQATGTIKADRIQVEGEYFFTAKDGSVFTVTEHDWFRSAKRKYISGPKAGQTEEISNEQENEHRQDAEMLYGKYISGGLFSEDRFIPGKLRKTLPITEDGRAIGYIDENGEHYFTRHIQGPPRA